MRTPVDGRSRAAAWGLSVLLAAGALGAVVAAPAAGAPTGGVGAWGWNPVGQLGDGTNTTTTAAVSVLSSGALAGKTVTQLSAGLAHSCAVTSDGALVCWGANNVGQLGVGAAPIASNVPLLVSGGSLAGKTVTRVSTGETHTCALTSDGTAHCWGGNNFGQLGTGGGPSNVPVAVFAGAGSVLGGKTVMDISAGSGSTCAVAGGAVACWGLNSTGGLGDGTTTNRNVPVPVVTAAPTILNGKTVTQVSVGLGHACARTSDGGLACWGWNNVGQLGVATGAACGQPCSTIPLPLTDAVVPGSGALAGRSVAQVSAGNFATCAATTDGSATCWGFNGTGQVGDGTTTNRPAPTLVFTGAGSPLAGKQVVQVATMVGRTSVIDGRGQACAATSDGTIACWGWDNQGQVGLPPIAPTCGGEPCSRVPQSVTGSPGSGVMAGSFGRAVTCGFGFTLGLTATAPGAPTGVVGTAGDSQATVTWTAPGSDGGSAITQYVVQQSVDAGVTWTAAASSPAPGTATSLTVTGLTNGINTSFRVAAVNAAGQGPYSTPSVPVAPAPGATAPGAPTGLTATAGNAQAVLSWAAPASDGGQPVTGYPIEQSTDGGTTWTVAAGSPAPAGATTATVTGLTNGTAVTFRVAATNTVGTGAWSTPSNTVTPTAPVVVSKPGKVVNLKAVNKRVRKAVLTWGAPTTGGIATAYQYRWKLKGTKYNSWRTTTNTKKAITNLKRGKTYVFNVRATNTAGPGPTASKSLRIRR